MLHFQPGQSTGAQPRATEQVSSGIVLRNLSEFWFSLRQGSLIYWAFHAPDGEKKFRVNYLFCSDIARYFRNNRTGREWEKDYEWPSINLHRPPPKTFLRFLLYSAGHRELLFSSFTQLQDFGALSMKINLMNLIPLSYVKGKFIEILSKQKWIPSSNTFFAPSTQKICEKLNLLLVEWVEKMCINKEGKARQGSALIVQCRSVDKSSGYCSEFWRH